MAVYHSLGKPYFKHAGKLSASWSACFAGLCQPQALPLFRWASHLSSAELGCLALFLCYFAALLQSCCVDHTILAQDSPKDPDGVLSGCSLVAHLR